MFGPLGRIPHVFDVTMADGSSMIAIAISELALVKALRESARSYVTLGRLDQFERHHPIRSIRFENGIEASVVESEV